MQDDKVLKFVILYEREILLHKQPNYYRFIVKFDRHKQPQNKYKD